MQFYTREGADALIDRLESKAALIAIKLANIRRGASCKRCAHLRRTLPADHPNSVLLCTERSRWPFDSYNIEPMNAARVNDCRYFVEGENNL